MLIACTSILSLFSSHLYSDQFIFTLHSLSYVHSHLPGYVLLSGFAFFLDFFTAFLSFMSILSCPVPYFSLASGEFWTYLLFFCALCPFSPARFRISLWLPENFGLFSCFSRLYVHFLLPGSVLLSGFKSSPNLCVHSSSSYVSPSMLPLSSGDLIEWSLVCHSTLSYQKFCDRHSNHYDHPEELHQSVE